MTTIKCDFHKDNGPNSPSDDVYILVNPEAAQNWKKAPNSIPLVDVVENFQIWKTHCGQPDKLSNDEMSRIFGTTNMDDAILQVLNEGKLEGKDFEVRVPERGNF